MLVSELQSKVGCEGVRATGVSQTMSDLPGGGPAWGLARAGAGGTGLLWNRDLHLRALRRAGLSPMRLCVLGESSSGGAQFPSQLRHRLLLPTPSPPVSWEE